MKVTVLQENLLPKLACVARVASTRSALPVLENILLSAEKGKLAISATDLETGITTTVGAKVESPGALTVPARVLVNLVSNLPPGKISLSAEGDVLRVTTEKVSSKINGLAADEFPTFTTGGKRLVALEAAKLKRAIDQVSFAAAQDDSRPILTGILFRLASGELTLTGVDGFRLAEKHLKVTTQEELSLVIPARGLTEAARLFGEGETEILLSEATQLLFRTGEFSVFTQSLEGKFPDYEQIIPANFESTVSFEKEDLVRAVQLTNIFTEKGAGIVKLALNPAKKTMEVSSQEPELGEAKIETAITGEGKATTVAFNGRYLMDALGAFESEDVEMLFNSPLDPALFRTPSDTSYIHVIMPVRLQE